MTGLPFVWAFWAGRPDALNDDDVLALGRARDAGVACSDAIAREYFPDAPAHQAAGAAYLRDNIKYHLGEDERAALELFYRYAVEAGVVDRVLAPRFYGQP
jgi:chorismate dehydratase